MSIMYSSQNTKLLWYVNYEAVAESDNIKVAEITN